MRVLFGIASLAFIASIGASGAMAADAAAGKTSFNQKCGVCHAVEAGKNKIGPSLHGVVGRKAGSLEGFNYSPAMKGYDKTWDNDALNTYLEAPQQVVKGTKMAFGGLKNADERANVIAYLDTLK